MNFKKTSARPEFVKMEAKILKWWEQSGLVKKYLEKNQKASKRFSFFDGPITANNPMGVHHAWGRTLKDFFQRYKNMRGFKQRFQNGFDCQGLWVEVEVERESGFNSKKDIEKFGVDRFVDACKARVNKFARVMTDQSKRLGMFMDWPNSYFTNSETNNLYIWHFLKVVHQKGWLYKGLSSATWCPRCETGLSQHEQADGYRMIKDNSVYVKFKLKKGLKKYVLVWTTTPWTLAANVMLAVNPEFEYVEVTQNGETWYLAAEAARRLGFKKTTKINPQMLIGQEYESLYQIPAQNGIEHRVVEWDLVDPSEGTGVVHVAPGCGQEDYELGEKLGSAMLSPLDETGHFKNGYGALSGKNAHQVADLVIAYLREQKVLFKTEKVTHRYPHCWRCGTKCLFRLESNWFIDYKELRPLLKKRVAEIKWRPEFAGRRIKNWLETMGDWMISRKRYYGLALPFYQCECGQLTVIGSREELKMRAVKPSLVDELPSLHRPWIDEILIKCPRCREPVSRIPEVGDVWLDAGVIPFSTLKYLEDKAYWRQWFPAEFVCEMIEQVRLWYYSMLVYATVLENKAPYLHVLSYQEVRDEKGERMSKTKQTNIPFDDAVEKMGVDVMRWLYLSQNPALKLNFGFKIGDEVRRRFHLLLWNVYHYFITYAELDGWQVKKELPSRPTPLDLWLLTRLDQTLIEITQSLEEYQTPAATQALESFLSDFSTWWLRRSRDRMGPTALDEKDKDLAYSVFYVTLVTLSKVLAPFIPFLAEEIYQNLKGSGKKFQTSNSVHLADWPKVNSQKVLDSSLLAQMELVRKICEQGHSLRKQKGIKVRQPLKSLVFYYKKIKLHPGLIQLIKDELNVKEVQGIKKAVKEPKIKLKTQITPELKAEGDARDLVREIQALRKEKGCRLDEKIVVYLPRIPKEKKLQAYLKQKTLAKELRPGKKLVISK